MQLRRFWVPPLAAALLLATLAAGVAPADTLVAAGDIANPPGGGRGDVATARAIAAQRPDAVLALGDLQYERGEYANFLRAYDRSWGRFKDRTRPVVGNHEYLDPAGPAAGYFRYFGRRAGDPAKGWYSFDIGPWHAVVLNSNCGMAGGAVLRARVGPVVVAQAGPGQPPPALHHGPLPPPLPILGRPLHRQARAQAPVVAAGVGRGRPGPQRPQPRLRASQAHADHGRRRPRRRPVDGDRRDRRAVADPVLLGAPQLLGPGHGLRG